MQRLCLWFLVVVCSFSDEELDKILLKESLSKTEAVTVIRFFQTEQSQPFFLIDVRTKEEFLMGHISSAVNIPLEQEAFNNMLKDKTYDRNARYLLYCWSGGRSRKFLDLLKKCGFNSVAHIEEGVHSWSKADLALP